MQLNSDDAKKDDSQREIERTLRKGLSRLDKILPKVLRKSGLERRLREHAIFGLWPSVVGEKLAGRSRPLFVDSQSNLVVTVSDSAVGQEISLARTQLLKALTPLSRAAGIQIAGLRVDLKHYHQKEEVIPQEEQVSLPDPNEAELSAIELGPEQQALFAHLKNELEQADAGAGVDREPINKRVLMMYQKQLRLGIWRKAHGFPICTACGFAVSRLHEDGADKLCFNCNFAASEK